MSCLQLKENEDDNEIKTIQETMKHRWLVANYLCKQIPCLSKNMAYNFKLDYKNTKTKEAGFQLPNFWSCNNCHQVFTSNNVKIRSTPKNVYNKKMKKNSVIKFNKKLYNKYLKEKAIFSAICKKCNYVSKVESLSRDYIKQVNEKRLSEIKRIHQNNESKQDFSKNADNHLKIKQKHDQKQKKLKCISKSKGKISWKDRIACSTKSTQSKRKKNKFVDMLKAHSNKPSKSSSIISFLN